MKTVFISGINVFIGTQCARVFLKDGYSVVGAGRDEAATLEGVGYHQCDVRDLRCVQSASRGGDIFIHLAAVTEHHAIVNDPITTLLINWEGTKTALDSFIENKGKHFIFSSTGKVYGEYGEKDLPLTEEIPPRPLSILGKSKYIAERLIDYYARIYPDRIFTILRVFNVYGAGQKETFLVPTILKQVKGGKTIIELKDVDAQRDYVHINDVVNAIKLVAEKNTKQGASVFNVSTNTPTSAK